MKFKLTKNYHLNEHCKDGKDRNYLTYFLNDVPILKQKIPFDKHYEHGFDERTSIYDEYLLNGRLYQKRQRWLGCGHADNKTQEIRDVCFPVSKNKLKELNVPSDLKIEMFYEEE